MKGGSKRCFRPSVVYYSTRLQTFKTASIQFNYSINFEFTETCEVLQHLNADMKFMTVGRSTVIALFICAIILNH